MTNGAFKDNVIIVTGAASGIGAALALQAAGQGARLALADLDADGLDAVAEQCRALGGESLSVPTDVTSEDACRALVDRTVEQYGCLDTLINNAGIAMFAMVEDMDGVGVVERLMQVNFAGSVNCTYHALPYLKESRGRIVVVSSLAGKVGLPGSSAYAASKHALSGFFDSLRIELMDTGVSVSMVFPDFVATNLRHNMLGPDGKPMHKKTRLSSKIMTPDQCAARILDAGARRNRETSFSLRGRLSPVLKLFPGVLDRMAASTVPKKRKPLPDDLESQALSIPLSDGSGHLHVQRIHQTGRDEAPAVLMLHGTLENGRIYYSRTLQGLGPLIARSGFDVYVPDFRGRGKSEPSIGRGTTHGQTEIVTGDIPDCLNWLKQERAVPSLQVVGHSWGGVLMSAALSRFPEHLPFVDSLVYLGVKRRIGVRSMPAFFKVGLVWKRAAYLLTGLYGYLPARKWRLGAENETRRLHSECVAWLTQDEWTDPRDGFDYGAAIVPMDLPPGLYLAGEGDRDLGYPADVQRFMDECGHSDARLMVVGTKHGNKHDYDHVSLVTHRDAQGDHFPAIVEFLRAHSPGS